MYRTASATGALAGYDAGARLLTLRSAERDSAFRVADDARVWAGHAAAWPPPNWRRGARRRGHVAFAERPRAAAASRTRYA